jgi:uncharacterized protein
MAVRKIVHFELPTHDKAASEAFYGALFGWKFRTDEELDYTMFSIDEENGGGLSPIGEQTKAGDVLIYIGSDNIEADMAKAESLGATPVTVMEVPGNGKMGIFVDPSGNTIAMWQDFAG